MNDPIPHTVTEPLPGWFPASYPPEGKPGCWTRKVIVVSNLREIHRIAYFHGKTLEDGGRWQRPIAMIKGETPDQWTELPPFKASPSV